MRKIVASLGWMVLALTAAASSGTLEDQPAVRFAPLHVYVDAGQSELAAYQFELKATAGNVKIVGVEAGEHQAYSEPPYYDPAALMKDRIIIGAFNTGQDLPSGRTRVATLHMQITGETEPQYEIELSVAADAQGNAIDAAIAVEKGESK